MTVYLARKGFHYSPITIHKYMNQEMGLYAIVRPKNQNIYTGSRTRYLRISWLKISLLSGQIKNGVQISPTYS